MRATNEKHPKRILIIDDDIDLLMLLERSLAKEGYWVEAAASLAEGEELISAFRPNLLLLDINVNGEDGRQLCWKLKKQAGENEIKVIIISGYDYSAGRAVLFGADDLLPKPFQFDYLSNCIKTQLGETVTVAPMIFSSFAEQQ